MADMVDVSSIQHPGGASISWRHVAASGVEAVMVKASEGLHYTNPWRTSDVVGAAAQGLHTGLYHFARPDQSEPGPQVDAFAKAVGSLPHAIGLALDLEVTGNLSWAALAQWGEGFLHLLRQHADWTVHYTNRSWLASLPGAPWGNRLWLASPGVHPLVRPYAWQIGTATVPGISGQVDIDQLYDVPGV